jgi:hypothetical protein
MDGRLYASERLARILHEAGREAVQKGKVLNRPVWGDEPFTEWHELPEAAKEGRRMQAQYLIEHKLAVMAALEAAFE